MVVHVASTESFSRQQYRSSRSLCQSERELPLPSKLARGIGIDRQYDQVGRTAGVERRRRQGQAAEGANRTEARLFQAGDEVGGKQRPLWGGVHLDAPTVLPFNKQRNVEGDTACRQVIVGEAPDEDLLAVVDAALGGEEAGLSLPAQVVIQVLGDQ